MQVAFIMIDALNIAHGIPRNECQISQELSKQR